MSFQDAIFDGFPGIGIPKVFINIMSCCGFAIEEKNCHFDVPYQVSLILPFKRVLIIDPKSDALDNVPLKFKQQIYTIDKFGTDSSIPRNISIPSDKTL